MAVAAAAGWLWFDAWESPPSGASGRADLPASMPQPAAARAPVSTADVSGAVPPQRASVPDPIGAAPDLKRVFDEYRDSSNFRERKVAARAFGACVPAFLAADEQTPSPEPLIRALPQENRNAREAAYWVLFARCRNFLGDGRAALEGQLRELKASTEAQEPGVRAQEDLLAGRTDRIDALVAQGLSANDAAAVAGMAGVAAALASARDPDGSDADLALRARAVDAALPLVACDLGLDCSAASLQSLQMCALQGSCEGDLAARFAQRSEGIDPSRVQQERARLLALIRGGRPLAAADVLP